MTQTFDSIAPPIPRDRWTRPLVTPPNGDKPVPYTRCTTYVGVLEDTYKLGQWQQRMVATGLSLRSDLLTAAAAHRDDRDRLDKICEQAREAAQATAGATHGTALHALTEQHDRGFEIGALPDAVQADLDAYIEATRNLTAHHVEQFMVHDDLMIGGTPDRIVDDGSGRLRIADVKTGSIEYGIGKIAMQLAVYAHSLLYDWQANYRTSVDIDTDTAIVIHLPAGSGTCELVEVDIAAGWRAVDIATRVRDWRKRAKFAALARRVDGAVSPKAPDKLGPERLDSAVEIAAPDRSPIPSLADRIAAADSEAALLALWQEHARDWTAEHTELAKARKALLAAHMTT